MYEFIVKKKEPNPHPWGKSWGKDESSWARWVVFRENSKLWTKIHTRLTWVSRVRKVVQQFYWLITIFGSIWGKAGYTAKLHKNALKSYLFFYSLPILPSDQRKFCFFEHFLGNFLKNYGNFFGKSRATCGKQGCYFAHIRDGLFFFWSGQMRNIEENCLQGWKDQINCLQTW